ncbi:MAG: formylglycine-generating enzyme family protein [Kiritimatiellae bacterium]|nr:formylglycine-generating enzyme family protein [Kiritimatiellia bacterium]
MKSAFRIAASCCCLAAVSVAAGATVSGVGFSQDPQTGRATITYSIDEPAIITVDVRTNRGDGVYASIGADKLRLISGEVNKFVTNVNSSVSASWPLNSSMPEQTIGAARVVVSAWSTNAPPDYMAINLIDTDVVRYYVSADAFPVPVTSDMYKTEWLVMRRIPATGVRWHMGYPNQNDHVVTLSEDYYIGIYEFTVGQWLRCGLVKISDTYVFANELLPASSTKYEFLRGTVGEGINWPATGHNVLADSPIDVFRTKFGMEVDLPTEAQWEYACRAGTGTETYNGCANSESLAATNGWYGLKSWNQMGSVGHFAPNPWGLYDMYGGMLEWCLDWYDANADLGQLETTDPKGVTSSPVDKRVQRSSGWNDVYTRLYSNFRANLAPGTAYATCGFRLVAPCRAPLKAK